MIIGRKCPEKNFESAEDELEYIAKRCDDNLNLSDSNFGMYSQDETYAEIIDDKKGKYKWPKSVLVATGENSKERVLKVRTIFGWNDSSLSVCPINRCGSIKEC